MKFVCLNGKIIPTVDARISPFDHGFLYGDGIYETMRTIGGSEVFDIDSHLARLRKSANLMQLPIPWHDAVLKSWAEEVVEKNGFKESRVRISVTRGENDYQFSGAKNPILVITASPLADYSKHHSGVKLISREMERILPEVKSSSLLPMILGKQAAEKAGAFDAIFTDTNGIVTEGTVFNIVMRRENQLIGAKSEKVLPGTAQKMLVAKVQASGYEYVEQDFMVADLQRADEVLITNSLFGCLPVAEIDAGDIKTCPSDLFSEHGQNIWI